MTTPVDAPVFRLGSGDVVNVNVWKNPDLSVTVPVRPDGYISVPLVGDIRAGGRTPAEIVADTERRLTRYIRTPKVSVIVQEIPSAEFQNRVRVVGGVAEPKSIQHRDGMTVIDLILEAGGINEFASPNSARLYRSVDGVPREFDIYLDDIMSSGMLDTNYDLVPGDVITIPERRF
ncbi:MAG: XrtA/PEP-CTERM system exopolysaccharide export protein [Granulosicoccus sp.]